MKRDRVSDDVCVFTSTQYAQVTAGAVLTPSGAILIDTLPFPNETREIVDYLKSEGPRGIVRFVINTHRHGDHTHGNYLFPEAEVIGHRLCRETLLKWGEESLEEAKQATPQLAEVRLRMPSITFEREASIYLGGMTLDLLYLPGHTIDGIGVYIRSERILFAGDAMMPLPYFFWGDRDHLIASMQHIKTMELEHIVQGHGDVLLRGEIDETIDQNLAYLEDIYQKVKKRVDAGASERDLTKITVEKSGGSPIAMDGMAKQLHHANLVKLYRTLKEEREKEPPVKKARGRRKVVERATTP
ncbi:MAG: MBL fold metallo-hydrolase [Chloroflexi bacterium]|nr:MBL fold metallo-hydrolase [Chloroflexota bacterium]MBI3733944.1 MBL fold metallo-hydrolase [Chloroflexota bacterium]